MFNSLSYLTTTGQWAEPMSIDDAKKLAAASRINDPASAIKSTIIAKVNYELVHRKGFDADKPVRIDWTIFGATDANYPDGHSPEIFEKVAAAFRAKGYEVAYGPSREYKDAQRLTIKEPGK